MELQKRTFPAPGRVKDFATITMREVTGDDEMTAASAAAIKGAQYKKDWSPLVELVKLSIVDVDGKPVNGSAPFDAFDKWRVNSRNAVMRFYEVMNGLDEQDLKACLAVATATEQKTPTESDPSTVAPSGG
jgi:hypothetical protein